MIPQFIRRPGKFTVGLFLLSLLILTAVAFHFNGLYGQDAHEYLRLTRALDEYFRTGTAISHSYFPILFPLLGCAFTIVIPDDIIALQFISMASLIFSFFYLRSLIILIHGNGKFLNAFLVCFFFFSPYIFRFGLLSMSDMLCLFFVIGGTYHAMRYGLLTKVKDAGAAALFISCALQTRYAVLIILLFPLLILFIATIRKKNWAALLAALLMASIPVSIDLLLRQRIFFFDLSHGKLLIDYGSNAYAWSPLNFIKNVFVNPDGSQHYTFWNIAGVIFNIVHPGFLFPGLLLLLFVRRDDFKSTNVKILIVIVFAYGLFIAGLNYQNNRYLIQTFPFVIVLLYPSFTRITQRFFSGKKIQLAIYVSVIVIQQALFWYSFQSIYEMNQAEREISYSLQPFSNQTLYTCSITGSLNSYRVACPVVDLYFIQLNSVKRNSLLLFNYDEFSIHFKNQVPMRDWNFLNDHYRLSILRSYPQGWSLYSIEPKPVNGLQ